MKIYRLFLTPLIIVLAFAYVIPFIIDVAYAFTDYRVVRSPSFVGLDNFARAFSDSVFIKSLFNFALVSVLAVFIGTGIAYLVYRGSKSWHGGLRIFFGVVLTAFSALNFVPVNIPSFFRPDSYGYMNGFLIGTGIVQTPFSFTGNAVSAILLSVLITAAAMVGPVYLLFSFSGAELAKKMAVCGFSGIFFTLAASFMQLTLFGLPSVDYVVHTPLLHMYERGFVLMRVGYMNALMVISLFFTLVLGLLVGVLFYNGGKIKTDGRILFPTKIFSVFFISFSFLSVLFNIIYTISRSFKPLSEVFLFPPRILVRQPVLDNFRVFFDSGNSGTLLWSFVFHTLFALIVFCIVVFPAGYALSKSGKLWQWVVPGLLIASASVFIPFGRHIIENYALLGLLAALLTPLFIASIIFCAVTIRNNRKVLAAIGGVFILLIGSYANVGIMGTANNPGFINIFLMFSFDVISQHLVTGIILFAGVVASLTAGLAGMKDRTEIIN